MLQLTSTVFYAVFALNIFLNWGALSSKSRRPQRSLKSCLILALLTAALALVFLLGGRLLLEPVGLLTLTPLLLGVLIASAYALHYVYLKKIKKSSQPFRVQPADLPLSLLIYLAILVSYHETAAWAVALSAIMAVLGYFAASVLIFDIMERMELNALPAAVRGRPVLLMTIGLVAMAFSGLNGLLAHGLISGIQ